jgi:hypothetical protein
MKKIFILSLLFVSLLCGAQTKSIFDYSYKTVTYQKVTIFDNWEYIRPQITVYVNNRTLNEYSLWIPNNGEPTNAYRVIVYNAYQTEQALDMLERRIRMLEDKVYRSPHPNYDPIKDCKWWIPIDTSYAEFK